MATSSFFSNGPAAPDEQQPQATGEVTTSFFYGGATPPEQNTVDALIDALNAKVAEADEDRVAAETAKTQAEAAAANAAISESNVAGLAEQAQDTLTEANEAVAAANAAVAGTAANAAMATTKAAEAAASATSAATSATTASTQASNASTSATAAAGSATSASTSATNAATSATNAAASATAASGSASSASSSATSASNSATTATTQASNAATSAASALASKNAAATSETNAAASATSASASATSASGSATAASGSASSASTSATNAAASATAAATSVASIDPSTIVRSNAAGAISVNSSSAALRITQTGSGNALVVEDSTSPDSTPFVVSNNGNVIVGNTTAFAASTVTPGINFQGVGGASNSPQAIGLNAFSADINGPVVYFGKSRGTTIGSAGLVSNGDGLGALFFEGSDGTDQKRGAAILASVDGTPGTNDMPGRLVFSTTADGASSPTERMRITSAGNVGIGGTPSAGRTLSISKNMTGETGSYGVFAFGPVQADVTTEAVYFRTVASTAAASFSTNIKHYEAVQGTFGATSTVNNQYGFVAPGSLTGATNNYGFFSNIASGTGRWNFYANGTAANYFAGVTTFAADVEMTGTGAIKLPVGTTAQRPTPASGDLRFNSDTSSFEGYNGSAWGSIGGGGVTSFNTRTGAVTLTRDDVNAAVGFLYENDQTVTSSYTLTAGKNAMSSGPVTVNSGVTVTVPSGSRWVIL